MSDPLNLVWSPVFWGEKVTLTLTVPDTDITGWAIGFDLSAVKSAAPFLTRETGAGIAITDGPGGVFAVTLTRAQTAGFAAYPPDPPAPFRPLYFDCWRTDAGEEFVIARGVIRAYNPERPEA